MNAVLVPFAILRCFATLGGGSASRPWRRASGRWRRACRRVGSIRVLLGLAVVLLALSPSAAEAGDPIAWGFNLEGQCTVPEGAQSGVIAIAGGGAHSLALIEPGEVIAWGYKYFGQCDVPADLPSVTAIAAGAHHSLALTAAGEVVAWGYNEQGQCNVPADLPSVTATAAGGWHSLALTEAGEVIAWGDNLSGQCTVPTEAQSGVTAIAGGGAHSLALKDGQVIAWGHNKQGQCTVPTEAQSGVIAIAAGWDHSLALTEAGTDGGKVIAWGDNTDGQCTVPPEAQSGVIAIAAGQYHGLALTEAGEVIAWGLNNYGQCTVAPEAQSGVIAIAAGYYHSLALSALQADFSGSPTSGPAPLTVSFTDLSTNSPTAWQWDFGDGGVSTEQNPSHTYLLAGIYTPTMTATNAEGWAREAKADYITVALGPPVAEFSGSPTSGAVPLTVDFTDLSTGGVTSWQWEFGDGGVSGEQNPSYTYLLAGIYTPSMTASNALGSDTATKTRYVVVNFIDVSADNWAYGEIMACAQADIVTGYPDGSYQPRGPVNRAEMAVYISRALAGGEEKVPEPAQDPGFTDLDAEHWAYKYVAYAVEQKVVQGYPGGDYQPAAIVTRDQMAVYVARALVAPAGEAALADYVPADPRNFPDLLDTGYGEDGTKPHWAYRYVEYCVENGVVQGYDDGLYHPERDVARDQMAVYIGRAFGLAM